MKRGEVGLFGVGHIILAESQDKSLAIGRRRLYRLDYYPEPVSRDGFPFSIDSRVSFIHRSNQLPSPPPYE